MDPQSSFGYSVSTAGDVNGDGLMTLSRSLTHGTPTRVDFIGRSYIFFGGLNMDSLADVTITERHLIIILGFQFQQQEM